MATFQLSSRQLHTFAEKWDKEWKHAYFNQFRAVGDNTFQFKINTKQEKVSLLVKLPSLIWESQRKWEVLADQPPIVNKTKSFFENQKILSVEQHENDRILVVECHTIWLIIELFGEGNIIVADKNENKKILAVLAAREWKGRTLKFNQPYLFPLSQNKVGEENAAEKTIGAKAIAELFLDIEAHAMQQEKEKTPTEVSETKQAAQKKALQINLERQQFQIKEWENEIATLQKQGEWIYAHFGEVEQLLQAMQRAKKQKMDPKKIMHELKKKIPGIASIDMEKTRIEWETE